MELLSKKEKILLKEQAIKLEKINDPEVHIKDLKVEYFRDMISVNIEYIVWLMTEEFLLNNENKVKEFVKERISSNYKFIILSNNIHNVKIRNLLPDELIFQIFPANIDFLILEKTIENAFQVLSLFNENIKLQADLTLSTQDIQNLTKVGQALGSEHDFDKLIQLILQKSRELVSADGGSIYLVERKKNNQKPTHLRFKKSALDLSSDEFLLPIDTKSIAGYVAQKGVHLNIDDVYNLPKDVEYSFNPVFDRQYNYHTKSIMTVPIKNHRNEVIGVLQLVNRKTDFHEKLTAEQMKTHKVIPFSLKCYELVTSLAGQAAVAIENNILMQDIQNLFEGFVKASITAIEQRDPTTSGHSFRVAEYSIALAKALNTGRYIKYKGISFSKVQLKELRYAALLHDFGKVGVREQVLVKPKKLYHYDLELVKWRFRYIRQMIEKNSLEKKVEYFKKKGIQGYLEYEESTDKETRHKLKECEEMLEAIFLANEPMPMNEDAVKLLQDIARKKIKMPNGIEIPFLRENELMNLLVRKGNLNTKERTEIESHVTHTYEFLIKIPWTSDLASVPDIAYKHHEKLDGTGYPQNVKSDEISVQVRMLTIADIFDALTALDRPYRKAIYPEKALDILKKEAEAGYIDKDLLKVFIDSGIYQKAYKT
ncbi:MAG: GAF domain-containing protein [Spirochaetia bacterium]|nr:GAF domain-containing protein [Spirochaetia bacterium]